MMDYFKKIINRACAASDGESAVRQAGYLPIASGIKRRARNNPGVFIYK
jgi:hypothetical protein